MWEAEKELLQETTSQKFRSYTDLNQWVVQWWQIASGEFCPGKVDNALYSGETWMADLICSTIRGQSHDMICINDPDNPTDFEITAQKIRDAFKAILPEKSSYEK